MMTYNTLQRFLVGIAALCVTFTGIAADKDVTYDLNTALGKTIAELREREARIVDTWTPDSLGHVLHVDNNGSLPSYCFYTEEEVTGAYRKIKLALAGNPQSFDQEEFLTLNVRDFESNFAQYQGGKGLKLQGHSKFVASSTLFCSQSNIELISPTFNFTTCFFDVNPNKTVIKIIPHSSTNSSIEYIQFIPQRSPVLIQGGIDFEKFTFNAFIVSHSDLCIKFKGYKGK